MTDLKPKQSNASNGFTIVEIIVVLAVAGFLAAIVTPNILSNVARQRVKNITEEAMQSVAAAEQLYNEHYTYSSAFSNSKIQSLAGVKGTVKYVEVADDEVVHLCYEKGDDAVVYCRYYDEVDVGGNHIESFKLNCDGDIPHKSLYTYTTATELGTYLGGSADKVEVETVSRKSIEDFSFESTTEATTSSSDTTTSADPSNPGNTDPSTEATTSSIHFDANKDYSTSGDVSERLIQGLLDTINNNIRNGWLKTGEVKGYDMTSLPDLQYGGWNSATNSTIWSGTDGAQAIQLSTGDPYVTFSEIDANGVKHYYVVMSQGINATKIQGDVSPYLEKNADGTYKETTAEQFMANMAADSNNIVQAAIDNMLSSSSAKRYEYYLDDDHLVSKRYYDSTGKLMVTPANGGAVREARDGDVYVDKLLNNIEVYITGNFGNNNGWFPVGSYTG